MPRSLFIAFALLANLVVANGESPARWSPRSSSNALPLFGVTFSRGTFVACGGYGTILSSSDGLNWRSRYQQIPFIVWRNVVDNGERFVVAGNGDIINCAGLTTVSFDGTNFLGNGNHCAAMQCITFGNGWFVAGGGFWTNNLMIGSIITSTDGYFWNQADLGGSNVWNAIAYGGQGFVCVGTSGGVCTSANGLSWTRWISGTGAELKGVARGAGQFVAVGGNGRIVTSSSGQAWTVRNSRTTNTLQAVTYGDAGFVAVGVRGTIVTSPDGMTWTTQSSGTNRALFGVTYGNGTYVAVGESGIILQSDSVWQPTLGKPWFNMDGNLEVIVFGAAGKQYQVEATSDFFSWTNVANITLGSAAGTCIDSNSNLLPERFYRVRLLP